MTPPAPTPQPWLPYVAPMAAFLLLTSAESLLPKAGDGPNPAYYATAYAIKIAIVAVVAWLCRSTWRDLSPRPTPIGFGLAIAIGLGVAAIWVGLDGWYPKFGV